MSLILFAYTCIKAKRLCLKVERIHNQHVNSNPLYAKLQQKLESCKDVILLNAISSFLPSFSFPPSPSNCLTDSASSSQLLASRAKHAKSRSLPSSLARNPSSLKISHSISTSTSHTPRPTKPKSLFRSAYQNIVFNLRNKSNLATNREEQDSHKKRGELHEEKIEDSNSCKKARHSSGSEMVQVKNLSSYPHSHDFLTPSSHAPSLGLTSVSAIASQKAALLPSSRHLPPSSLFSTRHNEIAVDVPDELRSSQRFIHQPFLIPPEHANSQPSPASNGVNSNNVFCLASAVAKEASPSAKQIEKMKQYQNEKSKQAAYESEKRREEKFLRSSLRDSKKLLGLKEQTKTRIVENDSAALQSNKVSSSKSVDEHVQNNGGPYHNIAYFSDDEGTTKAASKPSSNNIYEFIADSKSSKLNQEDLTNATQHIERLLSQLENISSSRTVHLSRDNDSGRSEVPCDKEEILTQLTHFQSLIQSAKFKDCVKLYNRIAAIFQAEKSVSFESSLQKEMKKHYTPSLAHDLLYDIIKHFQTSSKMSSPSHYSDCLASFLALSSQPVVFELVRSYDEALNKGKNSFPGENDVEPTQHQDSSPMPTTSKSTRSGFPSADSSSIMSDEKPMQHLAVPSSPENKGSAEVSISVANSFLENPQLFESNLDAIPSNIKIIKLEKGAEPLGATIRNEGESIRVARVIKGSVAHKSRLIFPGDEILDVNGIRVYGKSVNEVCNILSEMTGLIVFFVVPSSHPNTTIAPSSSIATAYLPPHQESETSGLYINQLSSPAFSGFVTTVKAHFNYDPEEDMYIPCRELGLSILKGDVLHIVDQSDANWWQAYRGDMDQEESALSAPNNQEPPVIGLIPSKAFQIQREAIKKALIGEVFSSYKSNNKLSNSFLSCARKICKLDKLPAHGFRQENGASKKGFFSFLNKLDNFHQDRFFVSSRIGEPVHPKASSRALYEEEILTYEQVSLFNPSQHNVKRPVVLIGPPDIGRQELRQRLMESKTWLYQAAIPHTSREQKFGEIDGQDYHFVTRSQFEADILTGKFIEHGEFEKNYYGTSFASLSKIVQGDNKVCVLNLHPQSLRLLKASDLKPYVVFIAPPNIEKLRHLLEKRNSIPPKEEVLREIIEQSREMEDVYGHFFDLIIINSDLLKSYEILSAEIDRIQNTSQWVPKIWLSND